MKIILFLLKRKLQSYFHVNNWKSILGNAFYTLLLLVYAFFAGFMYNATKSDKAALLLNSVFFSLLLIPIIYKFFPSFSLKKVMVAPQYPLSKIQKTTIDLIAFSLNRTIYFILLFFVFIFYFSAQSLPAIELFKLLLYWLAGMLFAENFINALSWQKYIQLFLLFILFGLCYANNNLYWLRINPIVFFAAVNISLFFTYYFFYQDKEIAIPKRRKVQKNIKRSYWRIIWKLLIRNRVFILYLLIGSIIQFLFPALVLASPKIRLKIHSLEYLFKALPFFSAFFLPTILFTYIYNNLWGYYSDLQINQLIIKSKLIDSIKVYISLLIIPLLSNFIIINVFLLFFHLLTIKIEILFLISCFLFAPIGVISAYTQYFIVEKNYSFGKLGRRTSLAYILLLFLLCTILGAFYSTQYYIATIIGALLCSGVLLIVVLKNEKYFVNKLKEKMLNKRSF